MVSTDRDSVALLLKSSGWGEYVLIMVYAIERSSLGVTCIILIDMGNMGYSLISILRSGGCSAISSMGDGAGSMIASGDAGADESDDTWMNGGS